MTTVEFSKTKTPFVYVKQRKKFPKGYRKTGRIDGDKNPPKKTEQTEEMAAKAAKEPPTKKRRLSEQTEEEKKEKEEKVESAIPKTPQNPKTEKIEYEKPCPGSSSSCIPQELPTLREWDPRRLQDNVKDGFYLVMAGKRRTGKSTFLKWLLQWYSDEFSIVWCMTTTKQSGFWQFFVGDKWTFDHWDPWAVMQILKRQRTVVSKFGKDSPEAKKNRVLLILDDVATEKLHDDPIFISLATQGRHFLMSVAILTQYPKVIGPKCRENTDCAFIFYQQTELNKETICNDYISDMRKRDAMCLIDRNTEGHNVVIAEQQTTHVIADKLFKSTGDKTKMSIDPNYALGGPDQKRIVLKDREEALRKCHKRGSKDPSAGDYINEADVQARKGEMGFTSVGAIDYTIAKLQARF